MNSFPYPSLLHYPLPTPLPLLSHTNPLCSPSFTPTFLYCIHTWFYVTIEARDHKGEKAHGLCLSEAGLLCLVCCLQLHPFDQRGQKSQPEYNFCRCCMLRLCNLDWFSKSAAVNHAAGNRRARASAVRLRSLWMTTQRSSEVMRQLWSELVERPPYLFPWWGGWTSLHPTNRAQGYPSIYIHASFAAVVFLATAILTRIWRNLCIFYLYF